MHLLQTGDHALTYMCYSGSCCRYATAVVKMHTKLLEAATASLPKGSSMTLLLWMGILAVDAVVLTTGGMLGSYYGAWPLGVFSFTAETISWLAKVRVGHASSTHHGMPRR